jgi:hypothetical protein
VEEKYTTVVTLQISFEHFKTCSPAQVTSILQDMLRCPAVKSVEQIGDRKTLPHWPFSVGL